MNVLDLFSGIGGFSLGLKWAGMNTIAFCEIDPFCQKVLRKNFPNVPIFEDIKKLNVDTLVNLLYNKLSKTNKELYNMKSRNPKYDYAVKMYDDGLSIQEVANFYKISRQAMWGILKVRGCIFRDNLKYGEDNHFFRGGSTEDDYAQGVVEKALKKGILIRKPCEKCGKNGVMSDGRSEVQAHHIDYNKPLDVIWFCQLCHHEWHKENKAVPREEVNYGEVEQVPSIDVICGGFP